MAKENFRWINTKLWDDNYIQTLDPSEKLLFIYFLTNPLTNLSGYYEISLRRISFDTGFNIETLNIILKKFAKDQKIIFYKGWIYIVNFLKNQRYSGNSIDTAIKKEKNSVPNEIMAYFSKIKTDCRQTVDSPPTGGGIYKGKVKVKEKEKEKTMQSEDCEKFNSNEYINSLTKDKRKHISIIGNYFRIAGLNFPTKKSAQAEVKRWLKDASILADYDQNHLEMSLTYVSKKFPDAWNLSTIKKYINNPIIKQ